jgi:hypothetical protein
LFPPEQLGSLQTLAHNEFVKATLEAINQMQADGVIGKYAIGGAVGATFYLEPAATEDVDVFVLLPAQKASGLVSLSPIYDYLGAKGFAARREHVLIGGWPVQFLPAADALEEEAVSYAIKVELEGVPTWVMPAEYLAAIALRTGRAKDHIRLLQFLEQKVVDRAKLQIIIERHKLSSKAMKFEEKFL